MGKISLYEFYLDTFSAVATETSTVRSFLSATHVFGTVILEEVLYYKLKNINRSAAD